MTDTALAAALARAQRDSAANAQQPAPQPITGNGARTGLGAEGLRVNPDGSLTPYDGKR